MPPGTRLGEFELQRQLGEGGFSIVYLAWDHSLQRRVALKEYLPSSLASRVAGGSVHARSERMRETFETGLRSFINEARALAQFDHPALVKVHRFWEAQGTAYMVMPFYEGRTLKQTVREMSEPPDEAWLLALLAPLTEALAVIHAAHWYHRDIAPDNVILLRETGRPLLLDFGAARRVIGESTQDLTAILKPGFAPLEQYAESPGLRQGAWTDVYALAATVYWMVTGRTPPPAVGRMIQDGYVPLAESAASRYSDRLLRAIDRALVVLPERRTRSIDEFRRQIGLQEAPAPLPATTSAPAAAEAEAEADLVTRVLPRDPGGTGATTLRVEPQPVAVAAEPPPARRRAGWAAAGVLVLALVAVAAWRSGGAPAAAPPPAGPAATVQAAPVVPAPELASTASTPSPPDAAASTAPPDPGAGSAPAPAARPRPNLASAPQREPPAAAPATSRQRECAALLQRMSLGEDSRELADRISSLGCR